MLYAALTTLTRGTQHRQLQRRESKKVKKSANVTKVRPLVSSETIVTVWTLLPPRSPV